jgi:hypothetical protein
LTAGCQPKTDRRVRLAGARRADRQDHLAARDVGAPSQLSDQWSVEAGTCPNVKSLSSLSSGNLAWAMRAPLDVGVALGHLGTEQGGQEFHRAMAGLGGLFGVAARLGPGHWQMQALGVGAECAAPRR